jgi:RNA polymerase sigma-70 factor (ECF subfamily)
VRQVIGNYNIRAVAEIDEYTVTTSNDFVNRALDTYSDMVYRLAFSHMRSTHDAQDIFQDVFLSLTKESRSNRHFNDDEHIKAWLIRATINRCKSVRTSAWFRKTAPLSEAETACATVEFQTSEQDDLFEYLSLLSGKYRSVIHLFYCEEMSIAQIGKVLKAKESTVRTWLTRARKILKDKLEGGDLNE